MSLPISIPISVLMYAFSFPSISLHPNPTHPPKINLHPHSLNHPLSPPQINLPLPTPLQPLKRLLRRRRHGIFTVVRTHQHQEAVFEHAEFRG
ncbi:hypothetical protein K402DRAFT_392651 [Aulographum hederae CBS 113979]|uniref:Uncharacterized protein n=1 Tax=Aulographum hederae CBS 113979 TaxID=1176131 RepID=A0A6G1H2H6_9PEZI|nr:hypothetical protein K402DRAFT_392651 [Aulographum hederae CBS 113979]